MKARWIKACAIFLVACGIAFTARADALDNWYVRNSGTTSALNAVAFGNGDFITVGAGGILLSSTNGSNWLNQTVCESSYCQTYFSLLCVAYGNGNYIAGGSWGGSGFTNIIVSTNTLDWPRFYPGPPVSLYGAGYGAGTHLLVGSSATILTATNFDYSCAGKWTNCNWALRNQGGATTFRGAAFGNGVYVVVGDSQVSMTSTDTIHWATNYVAQGFFEDVAFGNGLFAAVTFSPIVKISTNGITWTSYNTGTGSSTLLNKITFGAGMFVAVGEGGTIVTSTNGTSWVKRTSPVATRLRGVAYGNGTFVAVGDGGVVLQSGSVAVPSLSASRHVPSSGISLSVAGEIGRGYRVQVSTNLAAVNWEDFLSFTNTAPTMEFLDTSVTNLPARFYRAVSP